MKSLFLLLLIVSCSHKKNNSVVPSKDVSSTSTVVKEEDGCGFKGTIEERIKDCDDNKESFALVMKSGKEEVYQDTKTGFFWGPRLTYETNFYGAGKVCGEMEMAKIDNGIQWRLPSLEDYKTAHNHGLQNVFADMDHWFWTSTFRGRKLRKFTPIQMWKGMDGESGQNFAEEAASVRCLGRIRR